MIKLTLTEVVEAIGGREVGEVPSASLSGVSTDSRTIAGGELFFALVGPRFDGHAFVRTALERGAVGAVIARERVDEVTRSVDAASLRGRVLIAVDDTVAALGRLGAFHRRLLAGKVIAVVGSNGKTTTKAMIDHVLAGGRRGRSSPRSFNNQIGVPLTLLSAEAADEYLVTEIGTNAPGEIAALSRIVQPDMAVVTSVGEEHLEGLGDLNGVAAEECSVFAHVKRGGFVAVNVDQPLVRSRLPQGGLTAVTFGRTARADLRLTEIEYEPPWLRFKLNERFLYRLPLAGAHHALNATGAIAIARRMGIRDEEIAGRLESFVLPPMRTELVRLGDVTVINDAYNANPQSAAAAIETLESLPVEGRRIVVFGEMLELGARAAALHQSVAARLAESRIDHVFLVGRAAEWMGPVLAKNGGLFGSAVHCVPELAACAAALAELQLGAGDVLLLKASRAVGLDRLLDPLRQRLAAASAT